MGFHPPSYYLVHGMGVSGMSMARFLHSRGYAVKATDLDESKKKEAAQLNAMGIETQLGYHDPKLFDAAKAVVVSPGIPLTLPVLQQAMSKGVRILGELDIFSRYNTTRVIAVTGTNGKTTVTTLIRDMLEACGIAVFMGGNIGTPLVDYLLDPFEARVVVAEVSSFQLDLARRFTPNVAVLLNVTRDHLDRYDGMAAYAASKWSLFRNQSETDIAVVNRAVLKADMPAPGIDAKLYQFSGTPVSRVVPGARVIDDDIHFFLPDILGDAPAVMSLDNLPELPGQHNRENIAAAALAAMNGGANLSGIQRALRRFKGLPHRLGFVREVNGTKYYNDSKATNVDAVVRALECFDSSVILILGGREKETDFSPLAAPVKPLVKQVIAMGEARENIRKALGGTVTVDTVATMDEAVATAHAKAVPGDTVLLSPACASFDLYGSYGQRGDHFTSLVHGLEASRG